jgi:hypothetical protein
MDNVLLKDITETTGLFYYMTMKEFERREARKQKKKYIKLSSQEKLNLHHKLKNRLSDIFDFPQLQKSIMYKSLRIHNYEDLFLFFSKANIFEFVRGAELLDTFFPCFLIDGNYAWISKNEKGHFRYFSKSSNSYTIGLDLIDLLEIYYGLPTGETIEKAVKELKIQFMEDVWMETQHKKYLSNLTLLHGAKKYIQPQYPFLYEYLREHLKVLETMNVIANIHIKKQEFGYEGQNIFFVSNSYIADFLGNYTISTTNKVINLFAVLGLIKKIKEEHIPAELLYESKMIAEERNLGNIISYYIIPPMEEVLEEANYRAKVLAEHRIKYSNISRAKIAFVFGEEFANAVYVQEVQKNKTKQNHISNILHKMLENHLLELIEKHGYATKKMVFQKPIHATSEKEREKELNKIWKNLLVKHHLRYIKPTKEMKQKYGLQTNEYIVVR